MGAGGARCSVPTAPVTLLERVHYSARLSGLRDKGSWLRGSGPAEAASGVSICTSLFFLQTDWVC